MVNRRIKKYFGGKLISDSGIQEQVMAKKKPDEEQQKTKQEEVTCDLCEKPPIPGKLYCPGCMAEVAQVEGWPEQKRAPVSEQAMMDAAQAGLDDGAH